ncbi:MAG: HypC/HybG/HupF family hydrogenase formation chaperone [Candidatus Methanodesulfokora sp.]
MLMCWGVPGKIVKMEGYSAIVDFGGGSKREVLLVVDGVKEGDFVVVHAGAAIERIERDELEELMNYYVEMADDTETKERIKEAMREWLEK